jgi:hypothetical protein
MVGSGATAKAAVAVVTAPDPNSPAEFSWLFDKADNFNFTYF